jgi:manganese/zinc/iron transport system permease protein
LVALMVVAGLPAVGAVLVTALVVIPPVAARFWTDRVGTMVVLSGLIGLAAAAVGVAASAARPGLATGPLVVIAAAGAFAVSFLCAPHRGWIARRAEAARGLTVRRGDDEGEAGR